MRSTALLLATCVLACAHSPTSRTSGDDSPPASLGLPDTLTGTLVSTDESQRVLVVTNGLIAAMGKEITDPPEYDALHDVECKDPLQCRFAANGCEGTIRRQDDATLLVAMTATSGPAARCEAYSGEFEISDSVIPAPFDHETELGPNEGYETVAVQQKLPELPRGHVVIGKAATAGAIEADAARAALQREVRRLQTCYETYLTEVGAESGVVEVDVVHQPLRRPRPSLVSSSFDEEIFDACVLRSFHAMKLPDAADGRTATIHYVVSFIEH